jgi:hypothetical protein
LTLILFVLICSGAGWERLPAPPLEPRENATGIWTGTEALIVGGSAGPPCPPNAECVAPPKRLRDGAAFDPATRSWRRIRRAPVAFDFAETAVVGGTAYLRVRARTLLAYRRDRWRRLPKLPFREAQLLAAGDRLVAYRGGSAGAPRVYDPQARSWSKLPPAPLRSYGRALAWDGQSLVLIVPAPGSRLAERPPVARAAAYDFATGQWRRLPDAPDILTGCPGSAPARA